MVIVWVIAGFQVGDSMGWLNNWRLECRDWSGAVNLSLFTSSLLFFFILFLTNKIASFSKHFKKKKVRPQRLFAFSVFCEVL